jgi:mannitol operon repressor
MALAPMPDELKKNYPHLIAFWPFLQTLQNESHRGVVLISCGFLEEQLKQVLLAFMLDDKKALDLIDGGNAPLGTFSSRISATYMLALISDEEYRDLTLIRKIRNDFAHEVATTFETQSVIGRCKELHHKAEDYGDVRVDAFGQFQTAAIAIIMNLTNRPHYVALQRRTKTSWLHQGAS